MNSSEVVDLDAYLDLERNEHEKVRYPTFLKLFFYMLKHRAPLILGLLAVIVATVATLLEPRLFGYAIDEAIIPRDLGRLKTLSLIYFFITLIRGSGMILQGYLFELLGQRVTQDLRVSLFSHLQRLPVHVFDHTHAGRLLTRVTHDIASLGEMFSAGFVSMVCNGLLVIGILGWLLSLDLRLGLIASSVFPGLLILSAYFSARLRVAYREARSKLSALNAFLAENLSGIKIVHLFNRQSLHLSRFDRFNEWYSNAQIGSIRVFALFQPTITFAAGVSISLIIWYGGIEAWEGNLKVGILITYFSYTLSLFQPVREIADKWNIFVSGLASAERIFSVLEWKTEFEGEQSTRPALPLEGIRGHLVFENVWFSYDDPSKERWILKNFSLEIQPGERIGIVGHTGAGKSTLIKLLLRFYEPQRGRIYLDGIDLCKYDKRRLRATFGIIQQEVFLFSGGFEENIEFWETGIDRKLKKNENGRVSSAMDFMGLKLQNSNQVLNEKASNFSMGERQVIAFARALLKDPKIWILDEATSNLDSQTEKLLQRCLEKAVGQEVSSNLLEKREGQNGLGENGFGRRTCILIAHRLATVRDSDRIVVLNHGALAEMGSHEDLLSQGGLYAKLHQYQDSETQSEL